MLKLMIWGVFYSKGGRRAVGGHPPPYYPRTNPPFLSKINGTWGGTWYDT